MDTLGLNERRGAYNGGKEEMIEDMDDDEALPPPPPQGMTTSTLCPPVSLSLSKETVYNLLSQNVSAPIELVQHTSAPPPPPPLPSMEPPSEGSPMAAPPPPPPPPPPPQLSVPSFASTAGITSSYSEL